MDIVSHGLWGSLIFGRKHRKSFWLAFFFGVAPDLFSFGILWSSTFLGFANSAWTEHPSDPALIPVYISHLYDISHSFITFLVVFGILWVIRKKPVWELGAWGLHVLVDIPTHSSRFFPTPFLWPLSDFKINGVPWSQPKIFFPNIAALLVAYVTWYYLRRRRTLV